MARFAVVLVNAVPLPYDVGAECNGRGSIPLGNRDVRVLGQQNMAEGKDQ